ncbi:MAG: hypothetical protein D3914_09100, partial [Candidatus Electrothrix sp. LOE2]|nr:hypothetical protein [Candidatus Electrothrix sp. LOE2]
IRFFSSCAHERFNFLIKSNITPLQKKSAVFSKNHNKPIRLIGSVALCLPDYQPNVSLQEELQESCPDSAPVFRNAVSCLLFNSTWLKIVIIKATLQLFMFPA